MEQLPPKPPIQTWPNSFPFQTMQPTIAANSWVDDFLDFSSTRRNSHRRTVSDPIAFVEETTSNNNDNNNVGFERLDDEQLRNMFSDYVGSNPTSTNPSTPSDLNSEDEEKRSPVNVQPKNEMEQETKSSDGDTIVDPKRIKRILANRQSAQRSRVRKLQYISELERSVTTLQTEVSALSPRVAFLDHQRRLLNVDNSAIKQRIAALAQDKIFKDAHQEALKKEIERLRTMYHEQNIKKTAVDTPPSPPGTTTFNKIGCTEDE